MSEVNMATVDEANLDMHNVSHDTDSQNVEGEMTVEGQQNPNLGEPEFNTLNEPIKGSILRDVKSIGRKFYHVFYPKERKSLLKEWDLWGPLVLCTIMALVLQGSSDASDNIIDGALQFAKVSLIVCVGSLVVTVNSKLLGGTISFFQSICVLGYCLIPPLIALLLCRIILVAPQTIFLGILRFIVTWAGFVWATYASMTFLGDTQPTGRKALAVYPIFLFHYIISWLVIPHPT